MVLPQHSQKAIDDFFAALGPLAAAYRDSSFSFVAVKDCERWVLVQGILFLIPSRGLPFTNFASDNVVAAHYHLTAPISEPRQFVRSLLDGHIDTPHGNIEFPPSHNGEYTVAYSPFHPAALQNQNRMDVLRISGVEQNRHMRQPHLDWELRGAATPYDGIQELMHEYRLGIMRADCAGIEIVASGVAAVDVASAVVGEMAHLGVRLVKGLPTGEFSLGYRVLVAARVVERRRLDGNGFDWTEGADVQEGRAEISVPKGSLLHCFAAYKGMVQHFYWVSDGSTLQNTRRAAYEAFDSKLDVLRSLIPGGSGRARDAREFEAAFSWILWMLGFSVIHLGGTTKMQEAADVLATTPSGHMAVIECTTGLLKAENKLAHLHERSMAVRRALDAGGGRHLRMLTMMVTTKLREDVEVDIEQAERIGILVFTREDIDRHIDRTLFPQDPEQLFSEAEQAVKLAQAKHAQPYLPSAGFSDLGSI